MAQKRMFSKKVTDSDRFLDLPLTTQALYFHLNMHADDDGFVDNTKTIKRMIGASDGDLKALAEQNYIVPFETGVVVIKDWRIHNTIRKDRYQKTVHSDEFKRLALADNGSYTEWQPNGNQLATQYSIDKNSIDKNRLDEDSRENISVVISNHCQNHGIFIDGQQLIMLEEYHSLDNMDVDVICRAITESADNGKRNFKYILAVLRNWKQDGIKTISQVDERERQRFEQKNKTNQASSKKTNIPSWSNSNYEDPDLLSFVLGDNAEVVDDPNAF